MGQIVIMARDCPCAEKVHIRFRLLQLSRINQLLYRERKNLRSPAVCAKLIVVSRQSYPSSTRMALPRSPSIGGQSVRTNGHNRHLDTLTFRPRQTTNSPPLAKRHHPTLVQICKNPHLDGRLDPASWLMSWEPSNATTTPGEHNFICRGPILSAGSHRIGCGSFFIDYQPRGPGRSVCIKFQRE